MNAPTVSAAPGGIPTDEVIETFVVYHLRARGPAERWLVTHLDPGVGSSLVEILPDDPEEPPPPLAAKRGGDRIYLTGTRKVPTGVTAHRGRDGGTYYLRAEADQVARARRAARHQN